MRRNFRNGWPCSALLVCLLPILGCGAGPAANSPGNPVSPASSANLNGNWLLVGTLPFSGPVGPVTNNAFGVAVTFAVVGNNVEGGISDNIPCGMFTASSAGGVVTGTVAADNTFSTTTASGASPALNSISISGSIPVTAASSWTGKLTFATGNTSCPVNQTVSFTAVRIADVTGTYIGGASLSFTSGNTFLGSQNANFSFNLQQRGTLPGATVSDAELLTGTVAVTGISCFTSGTFTVPSGVLGSVFVGQATMNDGSTLLLTGDIEDVNAATLAVHTISSSGSMCGTGFSGPFTLVRH